MSEGGAGRSVVLAKPRTYMNESGSPVRGLLDYHHLPVEDLVVVHDELDLPFATVRLKRGGGEGGHNGLRSISRSMTRRPSFSSNSWISTARVMLSRIAAVTGGVQTSLP